MPRISLQKITGIQVCDQGKNIAEIPGLMPVNERLGIKKCQRKSYVYKPYNYIKTTIREEIPNFGSNSIPHDKFNKLSAKYMKKVDRGRRLASKPTKRFPWTNNLRKKHFDQNNYF